jgi:hypothetical protein
LEWAEREVLDFGINVGLSRVATRSSSSVSEIVLIASAQSMQFLSKKVCGIGRYTLQVSAVPEGSANVKSSLSPGLVEF